jgi:hypothetical protein
MIGVVEGVNFLEDLSGDSEKSANFMLGHAELRLPCDCRVPQCVRGE